MFMDHETCSNSDDIYSHKINLVQLCNTWTFYYYKTYENVRLIIPFHEPCTQNEHCQWSSMRAIEFRLWFHSQRHSNSWNLLCLHWNWFAFSLIKWVLLQRFLFAIKSSHVPPLGHTHTMSMFDFDLNFQFEQILKFDMAFNKQP